MQKAKSIREQTEDKGGIIISNLHLAEYYHKNNRNKLAKQHAETALNISEEIKNLEEELHALSLLAEINPKNSLSYFKDYRKLKDSLIKTERYFKEQAARIRYESYEKQQEINDKEAQIIRNKRNIKIALAFMGLILFAAIILFFQKRKIAQHKRQIEEHNKVLEAQKKLIENLQRELHHRIKNNLAIIDTFIEVAKDDFEDENFIDKLTELQNRIQSINELHRQLYKSKDITLINLNDYVKTLVGNIQESFPDNKITITQNIDDKLKFSADESFAIGLIINEFLTNSYKYAFDNKTGNIRIEISQNNQVRTLQLSDNGKGLPKDFDIETSTSFGIRMMQLLSQQLKAAFELDGKNGTSLRIQLKK